MRSIAAALTKLTHYLRAPRKNEHDQRQLSLFSEANPIVQPPISLKAQWVAIRHEYFPERTDLDDYTVVWSSRKHKSTLASCNVERKRILVARAFELEDAKPHLAALLYHEMCHAYLGKPERIGGRRVIHGKDFRALEQRHPGMKELDHWIKLGRWHEAAKKTRRILARERRNRSTN